MIALILALSCVASFAEGEITLSRIDMIQWQYEALDDVYWQVGLSYAVTTANGSPRMRERVL